MDTTAGEGGSQEVTEWELIVNGKRMDDVGWTSQDDGIDHELVRDILDRMILHWNYRNLTHLPNELLQHGDHVREIYMKRNSLVELPKDIGNLRNLTNLYLPGNKLSALPHEISQLINLEVLDVSQNALQTLPTSLGMLAKLQQLICTHNQVRSLPPDLEKLEKLQYLELSDNLVHHIPEYIIHGLQDLREFCIDQNPIKFLPRNLSFLRRLRSVSACKCDLRFLPDQPFHAMVHGGLGNRRRSPRNMNDEDEVNFQFRFDGNSNLKCVPYWLLRIYGPGLESFGCGGRINTTDFETAPGSNLPFLTYWEDKKICTYFFYDPCLKNIKTDHGPRGSSMLELALRNVYLNRDVRPNKEVEQNWANDLPVDLSKLLITGPVSRCFQCTFPIFTEMWVVIFRLQADVIPPEATELLSPNDVIIAYNLHTLNERRRTGSTHGFLFVI
ncbi:unnamed protein product [Allacma fusca]|uniref:Uncharacterized protein n=1 Tax=Allacma fusca TaxID=39272 RepID=A0A8J2K793_9HEXA|nr:unnamed protein product [Allacma fusca]